MQSHEDIIGGRFGINSGVCLGSVSDPRAGFSCNVEIHNGNLSERQISQRQWVHCICVTLARGSNTQWMIEASPEISAEIESHTLDYVTTQHHSIPSCPMNLDSIQ